MAAAAILDLYLRQWKYLRQIWYANIDIAIRGWLGSQNHTFGKLYDGSDLDKIWHADAEWHADDDQNVKVISEVKRQYGGYGADTAFHNRTYF